MGRLSKCTRPGNGTEAKGRGGGEVDRLDVEVEVPIATVDDVDASMRREEGGEDWNGSAREQSREREEERGLVLVWLAAKFHHSLHQIRRDGNWRTA